MNSSIDYLHNAHLDCTFEKWKRVSSSETSNFWTTFVEQNEFYVVQTVNENKIFKRKAFRSYFYSNDQTHWFIGHRKAIFSEYDCNITMGIIELSHPVSKLMKRRQKLIEIDRFRLKKKKNSTFALVSSEKNLDQVYCNVEDCSYLMVLMTCNIDMELCVSRSNMNEQFCHTHSLCEEEEERNWNWNWNRNTCNGIIYKIACQSLFVWQFNSIVDCALRVILDL